MILDDFVMLGTTVPEPNSDGRVFVCSAGVSAERRSLVRIYPLARRNIPQRWNVHHVPVELNPQDSRRESYKIRGDRSTGAHDRINDRFTVTGRIQPKDRARLLAPYWVPSIKKANELKLSLAIVQPTSLDLYFEHNPESPDSPQLALFDDGMNRPTVGARRFPYIPRLHWFDEDGEHHHMLRDWGCYELMRKTPERRTQMADALHLGPRSALLVGNLNHHRNSWLVISVLNGIQATEDAALFELQEGAA